MKRHAGTGRFISNEEASKLDRSLWVEETFGQKENTSSPTEVTLLLKDVYDALEKKCKVIANEQVVTLKDIQIAFFDFGLDL